MSQESLNSGTRATEREIDILSNGHKSPEEKMEILAREAARIEAMSEEERTLEKRKQFNAYMAEMDRIWSQLPRWKKRKIMNPKMKFSSRIKRVLKNT